MSAVYELRPNAGTVGPLRNQPEQDSTALVVPVARSFDGLTRQEREVAVTSLVERASVALSEAVKAGEPADVMAVYKDQAAAIADLTKRLDVSKDAVLSSQMLQRRAERGLGVAIRQGQAEGTITNVSTAAKQREAKARCSLTKSCPSPEEFATRAELTGNKREYGYDGIYALADNGTTEDFEAALAEGKAEGNVSRANIVRKLKSIAPKPEPGGYGAGEPSIDWDTVADRYPTLARAYEAEGHLYYASQDGFSKAATLRGVKWRFSKEPVYLAHVAKQIDLLDKNSLLASASAETLTEIDLSVITKEQADEALERLDGVTAQLNSVIRALKGIN